MDMSASSLQSVSGAGGSSDSLHGLKFKRNIYFADVSDVGGGIGSSSKASASAASMAAASPPKKGKGVVPGGQQRPPRPPRCQVEGCSTDLTGAKAYYCRHKVCGMHSKSPKVVVAGMEQRFCQQCSSGSIFVSEGGDKRIFSDLNSPRFHQLHEFDQGKRSCRRRLACHNERRRKPPPRPLSSHMGHLSSAFHEDNNHFKGFLVDFTHPKFPALVRNAWQIGQTGDQAPSNQYQSGLGSSSARVVSHGAYPYMQDPMSEPILSTPGTSRHSGGSDSSCALSLLSTQPWDSTSKLNDRLISARCSIDGRPIAEPVCKNDYTAGSWDSKGIEGSSSSTSFEVRASQVGQPESSHFSGELELALLGKRQCMGLDPSRRYRHSDDAIHWSL